MNSIRYFKDRAKAQLRAARHTSDRAADPGASSLQRVQHQVAVDAGFRSWGDLLAAPEAERQLVIVMDREPTLTISGFSAGHGKTPQERREQFANSRAELRSSAAHVDQVREWLVANIAPLKNVNDRAGSYGVKHFAEDSMGAHVFNGELIAAAIIAGYAYARPRLGSPNTEFAMSQRSITAVRQANDAARQARYRARAQP
ncbi:hypothetical protein [Cellulosimicrobium sp. 22601]|uniref:hypothetical protein n=1 Tax=unclassified Cellulosimicrobium TaxID=2624466 RepID=UPI003F85C94A